ncbi:proton-conducting transporter membrane subunit [Pontiellaceae bacterium B12219]|nr:proton-conducting transporter membrane subunit [Pontiellaceae bacterium B12219]
MLTLLSICFIAALSAPLVHRLCPKYTGALLVGAPLAMFVWLLKRIPEVAHGHPVTESFQWVEKLDLELAFRLDGLSLLFALLISGIGSLIILYTQGYFKGDPQQGRFMMYIIAFMASMLGVVLADHLLLVFIFWELTSFTSYLLIGFNHENPAARTAALQAMLVTVLGGLFLMAGIILLAGAAGTWRLSEIIQRGDVLLAHKNYLPILILVCIGAFTKSAQFPFHFWLPNAMQAPTPASAYLHSSTMVKAGVYLLARLHPALGNSEEWTLILTTIGTITFLLGAIMALGQHVLKRLLAYTTVSALGAMIMLLGIGTAYTIKAVATFILAHAFYKAALFLIAGGITHETGGETSVDKLGGLRKAMPVSFACAMLAGLSMGGFPPFFGFVAKETWLQAVEAYPLLIVATVIGGAAYVLVGFAVGFKPFLGKMPEGLHAHEIPLSMRFGPAALGLGCFVLAFFTGKIGHDLVQPAATAIAAKEVEVHLHLWAGFNKAFVTSLITLATGIGIYFARSFLLAAAARLRVLVKFGPDAAYQFLLDGTLKFAAWHTRVLQTGILRDYIRVTVLTMVVLVGVALVRAGGFQRWENLSPISIRIAMVAVLMISATFATVHSKSRLRSILSMGVVGFCMAILFTFFGAPDLAMTQLVIETLTVILLALAFYHLPAFSHGSKKRTRATDIIIASSVGITITLLVLAALHVHTPTPVSDFYLDHSYKDAHGRNVVNVILVDFRALDTLGEITVLAIAALGAYALMKLKPKKGEGGE